VSDQVTGNTVTTAFPLKTRTREQFAAR